MVPNGWKKGVIEDIAKVSSGGTPSRQNDSYWLDGQIPWVTTTEVQFGVINDTEQKITEAGLKNSSAKLFPKDTILMAMYGQGKTRGQVAKLGIEASTNQACAALLLNDGFEVDYYYQYLVSQYENIRELANSGGQQNLSAGIIKGIHVPIPPQLEQRKIAKILSTWDKAISTTERLIDNSKQQKKALMQQLLTGKKRLLDDSGKPFEGEWEEVKLGDVVSTGRGFAFKSTQYSDSGYKIVRVTNIDSSGKIDLSDCVYIPAETVCEYKKYELLENDILLVMVGATAGKLGFVSKNTLPALLNQNMWSLRAKNKSQLCQIFLRHVIYKVVAKYLLSQQGSARGFFTQKTFESVKFSIPSIQEQQKIAAVLANSDRDIELLEKQLADLKQEKKALMQQLLTGKRRVAV